MPWNTASWMITVCLIIKLCFINFGFTESRQHNVYWNRTNPRFNSGEYTIHINQLDVLEMYCPNYSQTNITYGFEYYSIYIVSKEQYDNCDTHTLTKKDLIVNCSTPLSERRYTILIREFSGIPGSRDYRPGTYYFITTSDGSLSGISNRYDGACRNHNMKVKMEVCCTSTTRTQSPGLNNTGTTRGPSQNTPRPSSDTTRTRTTTSSTTKTTTTPTTTPTTTRFTTHNPPQIIPTTNLPGGRPHDPTDIIIDAPGTLTNKGTINSAPQTLRPSSYVLILTTFLLTFALFSR